MLNFTSSESSLERALKSIPLGSQTFSKSYKHYPKGASPLFVDSAHGAYVTDVDGNEYIDLVNSLAAVTIGYTNDKINHAVKKQLDKGTIFSLPSILETELAEKLIRHIPSAEKVRFGKNASDATSAAVRVSRAFTNRDKIAVCGYHGWHDWYIGSTDKNLGVPEAVSDLTSTFQFNDIESLKYLFEQQGSEYAAVIMEPMNVEYPKPGFLEEVKSLCHRNGSLLIFDETVTGFRLNIGGAQSLFNVTPDLSCFGKGMANGFPISAVVGRSDIMAMFDEVFFSFTFGGELLSIAAAIETISILEKDDVLNVIKNRGSILISALKNILKKHELEDYFYISGHPSWSFINFKISDQKRLYEIKTLFMQECISRGLLTLGSNNLSYAIDDEILNKIISIYDEVFFELREVLVNQRELNLRCESLQPLFKVRK